MGLPIDYFNYLWLLGLTLFLTILYAKVDYLYFQITTMFQTERIYRRLLVTGTEEILNAVNKRYIYKNEAVQTDKECWWETLELDTEDTEDTDTTNSSRLNLGNILGPPEGTYTIINRQASTFRRRNSF